MDDKVRHALEAKFPNDAVKQRKGSFGKNITYVDGAAVVARLNDCFEAAWDFTIVEHHVLDTGEVLVLGRLSAFCVVKEAFGRGMPAVSKETGEVISAADAYKAAATDALKKCATLLGVAAYLYSDDYQEDQPQPKAVRSVAANGDRLTQKQLSAIWSLGRSLGFNADQLRRRVLETFAVAPEGLTKKDASTFISQLNEESRGAA